jgi:hypothetical protein
LYKLFPTRNFWSKKGFIFGGRKVNQHVFLSILIAKQPTMTTLQFFHQPKFEEKNSRPARL